MHPNPISGSFQAVSPIESKIPEDPVLRIPDWHAASNGLKRVIRISVRNEPDCTVVTIDGQLSEADLEELRRVRDSVSGATTLNLRGLDSCVGDGIQLIRTWLDAGARLEDATPYLRMMLEKRTN
jgi:hypothetical protein